MSLTKSRVNYTTTEDEVGQILDQENSIKVINHFLEAKYYLTNEKYHLASRHIDLAISTVKNDSLKKLECIALKARIVFAKGGHDQEAFKLMLQVKRELASRKEKNVTSKTDQHDRLFAESLYYIGLWSYLTENEINAVSHLKQYLELASSLPSLRLPAKYPKKILRAAEAALIDPKYYKTNMLVKKRRFFEAIEIVESVVNHAGLNMSDHWLLALGAKAYFATGKHEKARLYARYAVRREPQCPDAALVYAVTSIWSKSKVLSENGEAILLSLLNKKTKSLAFKQCGQGIVHAQRIKLASMYSLALLYGMRGDFESLNKFVRRYISAFRRYDAGHAGKDNKLRDMVDLRKKIGDGDAGIKKLCRYRLERIFG